MIRLETQDILNISMKQIATIFKMKPLELRFVTDFQGEKYLLTNDKLHLSNQQYWAKVMECVFDDHVRPVLMCEVLYFLRNEFLKVISRYASLMIMQRMGMEKPLQPLKYLLMIQLICSQVRLPS